MNEEWVEGELGGTRGIFPASFVDHLPPDLPMKLKQTDTKQDAAGGEVCCINLPVYLIASESEKH